MKKLSGSKIPGFYNLSLEDRHQILQDLIGLDSNDLIVLNEFGYISFDKLNQISENVVGSYQLPLGIACNFKINSKDVLIPMVTEEPSVIAAASNAARIARETGGFLCEKIRSVMFSQIQITNLPNMNDAKEIILLNKNKILKIANEKDPLLIKLGGGAFDIECRKLETFKGDMLIVHLIVDVLDAMGANIVNTMAEAVAPFISDLCQGKVYLRIISNLPIHRIAEATAVFKKDLLGGEEVVEGILNAYAFAKADPFRAVTHNKGIMNGIIGLTVATGNDSRAIEAGAHAYASLSGKYGPLSEFDTDSKGDLVGKLKLPLSLGLVGGMTNIHPMVKINLKILKVKSSEELSQIAVALGLAQNVAALKALTTEGIQLGHMKLHKRKLQN